MYFTYRCNTILQALFTKTYGTGIPFFLGISAYLIVFIYNGTLNQ